MEEDGHGMLYYIMEEDGLYYRLSSTQMPSSTYIVPSIFQICNGFNKEITEEIDKGPTKRFTKRKESSL